MLGYQCVCACLFIVYKRGHVKMKTSKRSSNTSIILFVYVVSFHSTPVKGNVHTMGAHSFILPKWIRNLYHAYRLIGRSVDCFLNDIELCVCLYPISWHMFFLLNFSNGCHNDAMCIVPMCAVHEEKV